MIKLAVMTCDENYLQQLTNRLQGENDITIHSTIIIKNIKSEVEQAFSFVKQMMKKRPDILLLDQVIMQEVASLDLKRIIHYRDKLPTVKTIVVGERFNEEHVMVMIQGGSVRGVFRAALGDEYLIKCIRVVARGEIWLEAVLNTYVLEKFIKESMEKRDFLKSLPRLSSAKLKMLSKREMEILALMSQSMTNEEIADKLKLSVATVKTHTRNLFAKSGIRNRVEATLIYTRYTLMSH